MCYDLHIICPQFSFSHFTFLEFEVPPVESLFNVSGVVGDAYLVEWL